MADQPAPAPGTQPQQSAGQSGAAKPDGKTTEAPELDPNTIYVKVYSPYQVYYDGDAQSITAENDTGPFDILPRHHNFMTLVNEGEVTIRADGQEDKTIRISHGVMHVRRNKITLFLDV